MEERIFSASLRRRVSSAREAAASVLGGAAVALGGYTSTGYPKEVSEALCERARSEAGFSINIVTGSNLAPVDAMLALSGAAARRTPMIEGKEMAAAANRGEVVYVEQQMSRLLRLLESGALGRIELAVVEALAITDMGIVPTSSVGFAPRFLEMAERVIVEINLAQPRELMGLHDVYLPAPVPDTRPIPLMCAAQRIGTPYMPVDPEKISHIVFTNRPEEPVLPEPGGETVARIAGHLLDFLRGESARRGALPPVQTGFGKLAGGIVRALAGSGLKGLTLFCGGVSEQAIELLAEGRIEAISTGSVQMTPRVAGLIRERRDTLGERLIIRSGDVTNSAEVISRLGIIALNSGIEADIYGNVNSSHIAGSRVVNGIGGGAGFAQNAGLSIVLLPSEGKNGAVSNLVPMVSHQDICEHDVDVLITEHGAADLRGLGDVERARLIIGRCAGSYRSQLESYLESAIGNGGHHPVDLERAFSFHRQLAATGSMRL